MKKSKLFLGVILGITAVLLLTLNVWGKEWYKLMTSLVVGVLVGIFISDHMILINAIKKAFKKAQVVRKIKINVNIQPARKIISDTIIAIKQTTIRDVFSTLQSFVFGFFKFIFIILKGVLIHLPLIVFGFIIYKYTMLFISIRPDPNHNITGITVLIITIVLTITVSGIVFFKDYLRCRSYKNDLIENIYYFFHKYLDGDYNFFWWAGTGFSLFCLIILIINIIRTTIATIMVAFQIILTIPLVLMSTLSLIKENGYLILLTFSIAMGGIFGTWHDSYIIGYSLGTISFFVPILANFIIQKIEVLVFFRKLNLCSFFWQKTDPIKSYYYYTI